MSAFAAPVTAMFAFLSPGPGQIFLLLIIALLLYGGDLPEKAREWGKMFADFRRQLQGIQRDLNDAVYSEPRKPQRLQHYPEFRDVDPLPPEGDAESAANTAEDDPTAAESAADAADAAEPRPAANPTD
ncbi:MAG: hypothetical protein CMJ58_23770 [Planctomycetaceae bacterium]|nr:hypothetical protein [Planctomycetaceae bacterium]